jgi:nucleoside-diphosphate-sugar epimerase
MKVLLIGGTGLISTGITRLLLNRGDDVWHYNRGERSQEFAGRVTTIVGNRYDHAAFEAQIADLSHFDAVVEMIGYSTGDVQSLLRAFDGKCGHLVFCSTVDVYARPASTYPVLETEPFCPTSWDYAQKKAECERILWTWNETSSQPFTVIRPVHTYSESGAVLHTFGGDNYHLDRLKRGMPILIHGDGTSLWSSVHRDDAAVAFVNALQNPLTFGKSYHLPGDECVTWKQYQEQVAIGIGAPAPTFVCIPTDVLHSIEPRTYISAINFSYNNCFDATAAKTDLGYKYTVSIAEGARQIHAWLSANNKLQTAESQPQDDKIIAAWERLCSQLKLDMGIEQK